MDKSKIKLARARAEQKIYKLMDDLERKANGYNSGVYKKYFASLTDDEFVDFMKAMNNTNNPDPSVNKIRLFFEMGLLDNKGSPSLKHIKNIAKKYNVPLNEYVVMPYKNPEDKDNPPISTTKLPVIYCTIRPLQQMVDKKNMMSSDSDSTNVLTGQVTGSSKAATFSNMQTISLTTSNQTVAVKEMLGPRSDDQVAKEKMLEQIENTGDFDIDKINLRTQDKRSLETVRVMLVSAGLRASFGDRANDSYILPM